MPYKGDDLDAITAQASVEHLGVSIKIVSGPNVYSLKAVPNHPFSMDEVGEIDVHGRQYTFFINHADRPHVSEGDRVIWGDLEFEVYRVEQGGAMDALLLHHPRRRK